MTAYDLIPAAKVLATLACAVLMISALRTSGKSDRT